MNQNKTVEVVNPIILLSPAELKQVAITLKNLNVFHALTMCERGHYSFEQAMHIVASELAGLVLKLHENQVHQLI